MVSAHPRLRKAARIGYFAVLVVEALVQIVMVWATVRLLPPGKLRRWLEPRPGLAEPPLQLARDLRRVMRFVAPALPRRTHCLICAVAARAMLTRRGYGSTLSLGADLNTSAIAAHAWLSAGSIIVTGWENMTTYREVTRF